MNITNRKGLKLEAKKALANAQYDPKKLILIHTGASIALSLILALVDYLLNLGIDETGGLSGVGMRSVLESIQSVLMIAQLAAAMFWQIGYIYVAQKISKGQTALPGDLLQGFRQFGPVLRLQLITSLMYTGICFGCVYLGSILFTLTPWSAPVMDAYEIGTEEALLAAMDQVMLPMMGIMGVVMLVLMVPYYYRLRQAQYVLMENPAAGAMAAIRTSRALMQGRRMELFKLDLSFWWFYSLEMLTLFVADGELLLAMFGVTLPWSSNVSYYIFLVLCYLCTLVLYWWRGNEVQVTYARAYESLKPWELTNNQENCG